MKFELWLAFVATFTVISLLPGPSVLMVVGQALSRGTKAAFLCLMGELAGGVVLIALALFGVGAILSASPLLFQLVKWAGVGYMAYLGFCQIAKARQIKDGSLLDTQKQDKNSSLRAGFITAILNPKAIAFYVALLSQFLDPAANIYTQFAIVVATSTAIVGVVLGGYALLAVQARKFFQSQKAQRRIGIAGGGFLLTGSAVMAAMR